jgi:hypothetical protein
LVCNEKGATLSEVTGLRSSLVNYDDFLQGRVVHLVWLYRSYGVRANVSDMRLTFSHCAKYFVRYAELARVSRMLHFKSVFRLQVEDWLMLFLTVSFVPVRPTSWSYANGSSAYILSLLYFSISTYTSTPISLIQITQLHIFHPRISKTEFGVVKLSFLSSNP